MILASACRNSPADRSTAPCRRSRRPAACYTTPRDTTAPPNLSCTDIIPDRCPRAGSCPAFGIRAARIRAAARLRTELRGRSAFICAASPARVDHPHQLLEIMVHPHRAASPVERVAASSRPDQGVQVFIPSTPWSAASGPPRPPAGTGSAERGCPFQAGRVRPSALRTGARARHRWRARAATVPGADRRRSWCGAAPSRKWCYKALLLRYVGPVKEPSNEPWFDCGAARGAIPPDLRRRSRPPAPDAAGAEGVDAAGSRPGASPRNRQRR